MRHISLVIALLGFVTSVAAAEKLRFAPYKDELFRYPKVLSETSDGSRVVVEFSRERDVIGRDLVPEKSAKPERVSLEVNAGKQDLVLNEGGVRAPLVEIGDITKRAKVAFVFIHGANGDRFQGVADGTFGGNFNRLKNLIVHAGGIYLSPGLRDQGDRGFAQARLIVLEVARHSPGAPIFIACSSNGGKICLRLGSDPEASKLLGGMFLLGATTVVNFAGTASAKEKRVPIFIGHGSGDQIISWRRSDRLFKALRSQVPGYPVRFVIFDNGKHGTPMRLIDWRLELNRMLEINGK